MRPSLPCTCKHGHLGVSRVLKCSAQGLQINAHDTAARMGSSYSTRRKQKLPGVCATCTSTACRDPGLIKQQLVMWELANHVICMVCVHCRWACARAQALALTSSMHAR